MGNIMICGFGSGAVRKGWSLIGTGSIVNHDAYTGSYCLSAPGSGTAFANGGRYTLPSALSEFYFQFRFKTTSLQNSPKIFRWKKGANVLGGIQINAATAVLEVFTGDFATKRITGATTIQAGVYYQAEVHIKIDDSGGIIALRIDGSPEGSDFSGDTKPGADADVDILDFGGTAVINQYVYFDDCALNDPSGVVNNSWPDGLQMAWLPVTGDDSPLEFTPYPASPTTHYDKVDEIPPSGADYINVTSVDKKDKFTLTDLPAEAHQVKCVDIVAYALRGSANPPTSLLMGVDLGDGVDRMGASAQALGTTSAPVEQKFQVKPSDQTPWTVEDVNAMKPVYESAA